MSNDTIGPRFSVAALFNPLRRFSAKEDGPIGIVPRKQPLSRAPRNGGKMALPFDLEAARRGVARLHIYRQASDRHCCDQRIVSACFMLDRPGNLFWQEPTEGVRGAGEPMFAIEMDETALVGTPENLARSSSSRLAIAQRYRESHTHDI
jgi:hypothetical protein